MNRLRQSRVGRFIFRVHRWVTLRCDDCGRRFLWKDSVNSYGGKSKYHDRCMAYRTWRGKAQERLAVLDLVAEVWNVDASTVRELASGRAAQNQEPDASDAWGLEPSKAWDKAWRVFYDLENYRNPKEWQRG